MVKKCHTTKYRKRRVKERLASVVRAASNQKKEALYWARQHEIETAKARDFAERRPLVQSMANILAKHICDLDPSYKGLLSLREIFKMTSVFGVNPWPHFPTVPEDTRHKRLESQRECEVVEG